MHIKFLKIKLRKCKKFPIKCGFWMCFKFSRWWSDPPLILTVFQQPVPNLSQEAKYRDGTFVAFLSCSR
jgi:hypothetical protein